MSYRCVLLVSVVVLGLSSVGCAGGSDVRSTPTSPSTEQNAASSDGATRSPQPPRPDPPPATGTCVADAAQFAIGRPASAALLERARLAATASIARFIRPNEAITLEYSGARLNLYLNGRDVVQGVTCG
jgi:hypothetical protein